MTTARDERRLGTLETRQPLAITVDGEPATAFAGESVATALLAMGRQVFRHTDRQHAPRGLYCGMGVCFDCLVTIDGIDNVRACMTPVAEGMAIETRRGPSAATGSEPGAAAGGQVHA